MLEQRILEVLEDQTKLLLEMNAWLKKISKNTESIEISFGKTNETNKK